MIDKLSLALLLASAPLAAVAAQPATGESPAAEQSAQPAGTAEQRSEAPAERRICRRVETTGQRTGAQRLCLTAEQWRRAAD